MIYVDVFSGFLGAGKTMLIKKMIEDGFYAERIAIIENEFGEVSIDGAILRKTNTVVKEINAGCICCQVTGDFKDSVLEVIENYDVDRILIEPTGIAKLSEIKKALNDKTLKDKLKIDNLISVVDGIKFNLYLNNFKAFFEDQIKGANVIVVSRTQNLSVSELNDISGKIKKINARANIITKSWYEANAKELLSCINFKNSITDKVILGRSSKGGVINKIENNDVKFDTFALKLNKEVSEGELISKFNFIKSNTSYGNLVRAKGIIHLINGETKQFNYTLSELTMDDISEDSEGIISFIGVNLDKDKIIKFFL